MDIGFIDAQISHGSSKRLWKSVASRFPENGNDRLFVFPGGVYSSNDPAEALGNYVFKKASPKNLDGAILWLSSLTGVVGSEQVMGILRPKLPQTLVTISGKTELYPDIPDITFDTSYALKEITKHFINKHNIRRIAFIRGPEGHMSANERFSAYRKVLEEYKIPYDEKLVSSPVFWDRGRKAMRELLDTRSLVPGRDFEAIICASDLLMIEAEAVLNERGYKIPYDVKISGFNDSRESKVLRLPATTARMPNEKMGHMAVESIRKKLSGQAFVPDQSLVAQPVFRRSCGCHHVFNGESFQTPAEYFSFLNDVTKIPAEECKLWYEKLTGILDEQSLLSCLSGIVRISEDIYVINELLSTLENLSFLDREKARDIVSLARELLPEVVERIRSEKDYKEQQITAKIGSFKNELLGNNRLSEIAQTLEKHCKDITFEEVYLVIDKDDGINTLYSDGEEIDFPSDLILPEKMYSDLAAGVYVVFPLHDETTYFGHLLIKTTTLDGHACTMVAEAVSSAVKSSLLFEQTIKARLLAERAEQDRTLFFSNVSENLREPLAEAKKIITESQTSSTDEKAVVLELIEGAEKILDLALSKTGELELNSEIERYDVILSQFSQYTGSGVLPCLLLDRKKITDVLNVLSEIGGNCEIKATLTRQGVLTTIKNNEQIPVFKNCDTVELNLAQNLVYMHKGKINIGEDSCSFLLPYPSISGRDVNEIGAGERLAVFGDAGKFRIEGAGEDPVVFSNFNETGKLMLGVGAIVWNVKDSGKDAFDALRLILSSEKLKSLPFITAPDKWSRTLEDTLRMSVETGRHRILQIGDGAESIYKWIQNPEIINTTIYEAADKCREKTPDLIVFSDSEEQNPDMEEIARVIRAVRGMKKAYQTPVIICLETVNQECLELLLSFSNVLLCNYCILDSSEFAIRIRNIVDGDEILPVLTGAIVKRAQAYLCIHACTPISRWQIAEKVNVSEDYLTRIFKKELGLSPWDYLNRYRIYLAKKLLRNSAMTINEVSNSTGFQDQAYFCRVFKKITGYNPSKIRSSRKQGRLPRV